MALKEFKVGNQSMINRKSESLANYLRELNRYNTISADEEVELARLIHKGGKEGKQAKERLVNANLKFVVSVANQFHQHTMELQDLISEGNIGLIHAAEKFDETKGFKFISFAVWWIRQSIMNAIADQKHVVRMPINQQKMLNEYRAMACEFLQKEQRNLTVDEFCDMTGYDANHVNKVLQATGAVIDMDAPISFDGEKDTSYGEMMSSGSRTDASLDEEDLRYDLDRALQHVLNRREQAVLSMFYGLGCEAHTLEDISTTIGISRERARQVRKDAVEKIRNSKYAARLVTYLAA